MKVEQKYKKPKPMLIYKNIFKPIIDKVIALFLLIILSPILLLISICLYFSLRKSPFFLQERGGYKNTVFKIIKFKTMRDDKDVNGNLLDDDKRLTRIGSLVRSLSLDELPQLINVLKGDMSLIGPRPFFAQYLEIYSDEEKKRHHVKPGMTGWAQINGRNSLTWKQKFKLDLYYVENISLLLDIKIVFMTIMKVIKRESVNQTNNTTMEKYNGSN